MVHFRPGRLGSRRGWEERAADHRRASREHRDVLRAVRRQLSEIRSLHRRALEQHRVWLALLERFFRRATAPR